MPNGDVTICEQLYWNKNFIIGNVFEQSIENICNSEASIKLAYPDKEDFPKDSACKECELFKHCYHEKRNKCWTNTIKIYGDKNWLNPDPRCIFAPKVTKKIY